VRFRYGSSHVEQVLRLEFRAISESDLTLLTDHYAGQEGTLIAFDLPSTVWAGYSTVPVAASAFDWRYATTFSITSSAAPSRFDAEVELISVVK
jgi:hypothetical protein